MSESADGTGGAPLQMAYKSTGPDSSGSSSAAQAYEKSVDPLPSQNPAYSGSGSSGSAPSVQVRTIDGKLVSGYATTNGGFASTDGTVYVAPGGQPEFGITDPTTGNFLPNGTIRVIGGQTVYGSVQSGTFMSEDGTVVQLSNGLVEHGTTDASGNFLAYTTIDGKQVWGNFGNDGSFLSKDGTTFVSAPGAAPEYGITDPGTGNFLPNGSMRVIADQNVYGSVQSNGAFFSEDGTLLQLPDGFVEHGKTDAAGNFLAYTTIDGKQVWGNFGSDGSFLSQDGTTYVPPNGGVPEHGITDPANNSFLPNGTTRVIDGQTVYGTVQSNGSFFSGDGTLLQLPDGFVEHGKTDASGNFLAYETIGGKQVWGNFGSDGSFLSQDGTVFVPAGGGAPEYGVTDPKSNTFLPGGTTYTLPGGGGLLFGYADAGGFWSYDGSTIVLSDGTVVTGSMNKGDGIFTGNNGHDYFVGQDGIQAVTPNNDGSFTITSTGQSVMTPHSWGVDLNEFTQAQTQIGTDMQNISDAYDTIQLQYSLIESYWSSPAGTSFEDATSAVDLAMNQLNTVLSSISNAMQKAYSNYYDAEQQTIATFQAAGVPTT